MLALGSPTSLPTTLTSRVGLSLSSPTVNIMLALSLPLERLPTSALSPLLNSYPSFETWLKCQLLPKAFPDPQ